MIGGVGVDILEIERVEDMLRRYGERMKKRFFNEDEMTSLPEGVHHMAGRIAAKEAVYKALSPSGLGLRWREIIIFGETGKPFVKLSGKTEEAAVKMGMRTIHLSISHTSSFAVAVAIMEV